MQVYLTVKDEGVLRPGDAVAGLVAAGLVGGLLQLLCDERAHGHALLAQRALNEHQARRVRQHLLLHQLRNVRQLVLAVAQVEVGDQLHHVLLLVEELLSDGPDRVREQLLLRLGEDLRVELLLLLRLRRI